METIFKRLNTNRVGLWGGGLSGLQSKNNLSLQLFYRYTYEDVGKIKQRRCKNQTILCGKKEFEVDILFVIIDKLISELDRRLNSYNLFLSQFRFFVNFKTDNDPDIDSLNNCIQFYYNDLDNLKTVISHFYHQVYQSKQFLQILTIVVLQQNFYTNDNLLDKLCYVNLLSEQKYFSYLTNKYQLTLL